MPKPNARPPGAQSRLYDKVLKAFRMRTSDSPWCLSRLHIFKKYPNAPQDAWLNDVLTVPARLGSMPLVIADAIAEHLDGTKHFQFAADFSDMVLPANETFVEFNQSLGQYGCWMRKRKATDILFQDNIDEIRGSMGVEPAYAIETSVLFHIPSMDPRLVTLDKQFWLVLDLDMHGIARLVRSRPILPQFKDGITDRWQADAGDSITSICWAAISMLNEQPAVKRRKRPASQEQVQEQEQGEPSDVYETLKIDSSRTRILYATPTERNDRPKRKRRLHTVRRHKRRHPTAGTIIVHEHTRGDAAFGTIHKDYRPEP